MELKEILKYQIETLEELDELLNDEREILIKDRAGELPGVIEKKKLVAQKLSLLEKKRIEMSGSSTAADLIKKGIMNSEQLTQLEELVGCIRQKEETNLILTKQSINYIRLITSALNPKQKVVTYGNSGRIGEGSASGIFTTKA